MAKDCKITQKKIRPDPNPDDIKTAVLKVVNKEGSVRQIALAINLEKTTIQRYVNKYEKLPNDGKKDVFLTHACKPSFAHHLQTAKMASSRTSAQNNGPRAQNNDAWV